MPLPIDFQFSQSSLQDYADCAHRFELRYILRLKWPALQSEPYLVQEMHLKQGNLFHRSVHQHIIGLTEFEITRPEQDNTDLSRWWQNYLLSDPLADYPGKRYPEFTLSMPFESVRLTAKYDLIIVSEQSHFVIFDWKTSKKRILSKIIKQRMQTRIYPFVLVNAGQSINKHNPIDSGQIQMIYWFADYPNKPEIIIYNQDQYQHDFSILSKIISEITTTPDGSFPLTFDLMKCNFCNYRSLCNRGIRAGDWNEMDESDLPEAASFTLESDLIDIPEIEF